MTYAVAAGKYLLAAAFRAISSEYIPSPSSTATSFAEDVLF